MLTTVTTGLALREMLLSHSVQSCGCFFFNFCYFYLPHYGEQRRIAFINPVVGAIHIRLLVGWLAYGASVRGGLYPDTMINSQNGHGQRLQGLCACGRRISCNGEAVSTDFIGAAARRAAIGRVDVIETRSNASDLLEDDAPTNSCDCPLYRFDISSRRPTILLLKS